MLTDSHETSITGILLMRLSKISCIWKTFSIHPLLPTFNLDTHTHTHIHTYIHTFGFIEKTSVKQDLKCKVCSNFQMSFFHLVRRTQNRWGFRSGWHFVRSSGQADLWSDIPPPSGFGSGWHLVTFWVRLTFGQTYSQPSGFGSG